LSSGFSDEETNYKFAPKASRRPSQSFTTSIATSILRRANFRDIANLTGGFDAWKAMVPGS